MSKNKRSIIGVALIAVIVLCVIGIVKPKDKEGVSPQKETMTAKPTTQSEMMGNAEASEVAADNSEEGAYGTLEGVDIIFSDSVRDDQAGRRVCP